MVWSFRRHIRGKAHLILQGTTLHSKGHKVPLSQRGAPVHHGIAVSDGVKHKPREHQPRRAHTFEELLPEPVRRGLERKLVMSD